MSVTVVLWVIFIGLGVLALVLWLRRRGGGV